MKGFCPLGSGSKGNCTFLGTDRTKVLIDAGLSGREIERRLDQIGVSLQEIEAIFVTHEHTDHIQGLSTLAVKHKIPVFANYETAVQIVNLIGEGPRFKIFSTGEPFRFQDLAVHPFSIPHDTPDPVGFTIETRHHRIGFCTDLGFTSPVEEHLTGCDFLVLEANHDENMVWASARHAVHKRRVLGKTGHLSNEACGQLLTKLYHPALKHVHLAHLSSECNHPNKAMDVVKSLLEAAHIDLPLTIAWQDRVSQHILFEG